MNSKNSLTFLGAILFAAAPLSAQIANTVHGTNAGDAITTGDFNSLFGFDAGRFLTSGSQNTILGEEAGLGLLDITLGERIADGAVLTTAYNGSENVFVGYRAGWQATTGTNNIYIGALAGANSGSSRDNTFVGASAGTNNTGHGFDNTFVGKESGFKNTTGDDNTFVGEDAGSTIQTGSDNTAIGSGALANWLNGSSGEASYSCVAVGKDAGSDVGTSNLAYNLTFVGASAGTDNGDGRANTFLGAQAGYHTEHADYNTFVGTGAGLENNRINSTTNASRNTYFGTASGLTNREGSDNVAVGAFSDFRPWEDATQTAITESFARSGQYGEFIQNKASDVPSTRDISRVVMLGAYATSWSDDAITIGYSADAKQVRSIAIGSGAQATEDGSVAIGYQAASHGTNITVIGNGTTVSIDPGADGVTALGSPTYRYSNVFAKSFDAVADAAAPATVNIVADAGTDDADSWRLQAADSGAFTISSFATGAYVDIVSVANNGDVTVSGDVLVNSDRRLKENITPINNALALLESVDGKTYHWKEGQGRDKRRHYGFVAQEIEAAVPELVSANPADGIKSVNYQGFIPILVNGVEELKVQTEENRAEIDALQIQFAKNQALLEKLTASNGQ